MSASLNEAAMSGNLQEVRMRLDLGEDVNQKLFPRFSTPLHDAIICGRIDVARELIQRGADVNLTDYRGLTPLKVSRRYGQPEIEEMLEAKGAQLEVQVDSCSPSAGAEESLVPPPWKVRTHSRRDELAVGR